MPPLSRIFFAVCGSAVRPSPGGFPERGHLHVEMKDINIVVRSILSENRPTQSL